MQHRSKRDPEEIRNIYIRHPWYIGVNCVEGPHQRTKYKHYIYRCKEVIFKTKLEWCKREIKHEIQQKRKKNDKRYSSIKIQICDVPKGRCNNDIEHAPHRTKNPRWWSPLRFHKCLVPSICFHMVSIAKFSTINDCMGQQEV